MKQFVTLDAKPTRQKTDQIIINTQEVLTVYSFTAHIVPTHMTRIKELAHRAEQAGGNQ